MKKFAIISVIVIFCKLSYSQFEYEVFREEFTNVTQSVIKTNGSIGGWYQDRDSYSSSLQEDLFFIDDRCSIGYGRGAAICAVQNNTLKTTNCKAFWYYPSPERQINTYIWHTIDAQGFNNLQLDFDWQCLGDNSYGKCYSWGMAGYRVGSSGDWIWFSTGGPCGNGRLMGSKTTQHQTYSIPVSNSIIQVCFRWRNSGFLGGSNSGTPSFSIDNIVIKGESSTPIFNCNVNPDLTAAPGIPPNGAEHHIYLTWQLIPEAEGYELECSEDNSNWNNVYKGANTYFDHNTGDNPNKLYYYRVRAYKADKICNYSQVKSTYTACDKPEIEIINLASSYIEVKPAVESPVANPDITLYALFCSTTNQYVNDDGSFTMNAVYNSRANWGNIKIIDLQPDYQYCFYFIAKNNEGNIQTGSLICLQTSVCTAPYLVSKCNNLFKCEKEEAEFFLVIEGDLPLNYQWKFNDNILNSTVSNIVLTDLKKSDDGLYVCEVKNNCGTVSASFLLTVNEAPQVLNNFNYIEQCGGVNIKLEVMASGGGPFEYQWKKDDNILDMATGSKLILNKPGSIHSGLYSCIISNNCGSASGNIAKLVLYDAPDINLGNDTTISTEAKLNLDAGSGYMSYLWNTGSEDQILTVDGSLTGSGVYEYWVKVTGLNGCTYTDSIRITINKEVGYYKLSGKITYENIKNTAMINTKVYLEDENKDIIDSTDTDINGNYEFLKVKESNYNIKCKTKMKWGGSNPIDALLVNKYFISLYTFKSQLKQQAANVRNSDGINPLDALFINRRFLGIIKSFPSGDWLFENKEIKIDGMDLKVDIKAICFGDVDGSY
ncbi:MAG: hypothetical protein KA792_04980 [Bacteroidales bacterium]|nr:hypothetical protein [Bacteroidales bacterium]